MPDKPHVTTAFCKIDGIDGGCTEENHSKYIELKTFSHAVDQSVADAGSQGIGITTGRSEHHDFEAEAYVDPAYPKLLAAASGGKYISDVKIDVCQAAGEKKNVFLAIELKEVVISHVALSGDSADFPTVKFSLNYGSISVEHKATKPDGSASGSVKAQYNRRTLKG
jgi:type VI secretion system secreted protein Hcp